MNSALNIVGVILIVGGILALSYEGFHYTKREKIAEIGDIKITSDTEKTYHFPPLFGGLSLAAGVVILVIGRIKK